MKAVPTTIAQLLSLSLFTSSIVNATEFDIDRLAQDSYWLKLGHYLPGFLSGYKSTIDNASFFISPEGKYSPTKELQATITKLYSQDKRIAEQAQCRYPARYFWLESLQGRQAVLSCPELETWQNIIDPEGLTLVFPTAFMNNPSSMFGHTLLRIDAKDQTRHKELVAFAVNFAAEPDSQDNPAQFAIKGLIGQYPGRFAIMPYHMKVREYNDIESRDIWEYKLKLSPQEVERIMLHLWEMQNAEFDYYFLDENCSYQLLSLIELARQDLALTKHFSVQAIPSDTVRILAESDLLDSPEYRAAFGTRLLHQANEIDDQLFLAVEKATKGDYPNQEDYSDTQRAAILELAYEWLNFQLYDQGLERNPTAKRLTEILYQRSKIQVASPFSPVKKPLVSPEQGHASARLGLSYQYWDSKNNQTTLEWRAAYHDLLDSQQGFVAGAQINFLDTQLSIDNVGSTRLDRFYLFDAMALAPSNKVFDSWSWNVRTGFDRQPVSKATSERWFAQGGYGKSWGASDKTHFYTLASGELNGGEITHYDFTLGLGIEAGALFQIHPKHRLGIQGQYLALIDSEDSNHSDVNISWNWSFNQHFALRTQVNYQQWQSEDIGAKITGFIYY